LTGISDSIGDTFKSYVYACVSCRAENISKAKIYLYGNKKNSSGKTELFSHRFIDLINSPNRFNQSFEILLYMISASLDLYGNAYLLVSRSKGVPDSFYFLPFNSTRIILSDDNKKITAYEYREGNRTYKIPAKDVIHFMIPSPDSNLTGKSLVSAFNFTLDIDYYQNLFQKMFYMNNASIGLILESPDNLNDEQFERLETKINQKYAGVDNSGKPLILEGGLKASSYKASVKDVEMLPARKMIRDEILAIMRVPKIILGVLEDVNYAGSKEAIKIFNDYTIRPFAKLCIESKFNMFLKQNYPGENLKLVMEYEFENDRALQLQAYEIYRKYNIASVDEIREMEGLSTISNE
jgi:HK97 family phage portal protein